MDKGLGHHSDVVGRGPPIPARPAGLGFFHADVADRLLDALSELRQLPEHWIPSVRWNDQRPISADFGGDPDTVQPITWRIPSRAHKRASNLNGNSPEAGAVDFPSCPCSQSGSMNTRQPATARQLANSHIEWLIRLQEDRKLP